MNQPADRQVREDYYRLNRAAIENASFDPRLSTVYLAGMDEVPDSVKNEERPCQAAYVFTFNNALRRTGDVSYAMRAAWKSVQVKRDQLAHKRKIERRARLGREKSGAARDLKEHTLDRLESGPRVRVVVA